jgi:cysteine synthase A
MTRIATSVLRATGNTPLVQLARVVPSGCANVLVKLESTNRTGSSKDPMALAMVEAAETRGALKPRSILTSASRPKGQF